MEARCGGERGRFEPGLAQVFGNDLAFGGKQTAGQVFVHGSLLMDRRCHHDHRASVHDHWRGGHELMDPVITTSGLGDHERVEYASAVRELLARHKPTIEQLLDELV